MRNGLIKDEYLNSGHLACQGCGSALTLRYVLKPLGRNAIFVVPPSCIAVMNGPFPFSAVKQPFLHTAFETGASTASGVRAALDMLDMDNKITVTVLAGDGGTFDIGLQALSGAAERNENILYICNDNEAYMNTGVQRSSATPYGAWTTTTPPATFKNRAKKNIMDIMIAHRIPYAATASIAYPRDLITKLKRAVKLKGLKFIHVFSSCPTGWRFPPDLSVKIARLAVQTRIFPLYEVYDGTRYRISRVHDRKKVREYLSLQGRFRHLNSREVQVIQRAINHEWNVLMKKSSSS